MRIGIRFGLLALLLRVGLAQVQLDVAEVLKKVSEVYKTVNYELVYDATFTEPKTEKPVATHTRLLLKAPGLYRMEETKTGGSDEGRMVVVHDGGTITFHDVDSNEYRTFPATALGDTLPDELEPGGIDFSVMSHYRKAAEDAKEPKLLRTETVEIAGRMVDCYVLSLSMYGADNTWWIDRQSYHVVQAEVKGTLIVFTTIKLNEPLQDELFKFTPPPGAKKAEP